MCIDTFNVHAKHKGHLMDTDRQQRAKEEMEIHKLQFDTKVQ